MNRAPLEKSAAAEIASQMGKTDQFQMIVKKHSYNLLVAH